MSGIGSILDMGKLALFGSQAAIHTTSSNIANVNTEGYSRRSVRFEELQSLDYRPGQMGTGVIAAEVVRHFDEFIESEYLSKHTLEERYQTLWENLKGVDSLFSEANTEGIHASMVQFFQDWEDLSLNPEDYSTRVALMSRTQNMLTLLGNTDADLRRLQESAVAQAQQEVLKVNALLQEIADINKEIAVHDIPGQNNANELYDKRALKVRELSEYMDIKVIDRTPAEVSNDWEPGVSDDFVILTTAGHTLVQGGEYFEIEMQGPKTVTSLMPGSSFDGQIQFSGSDDFEYTIDVVTGGQVSNATGAGTAQFRVSLDGGRTWLQDSNGNTRLFYARPEASKVQVGDLEVWFDPQTTGGSITQNLTAGDRFTIMPRQGIYWVENTSSEMNITPLITADGSDDPTRLVGGSLAALMNFASFYTGSYRDSLDATARSLIWEVNRLHSQGHGLSHMDAVTGTYSVSDNTIPLGSDSSGLVWCDRLQAGNLTMYMYDAGSGLVASNVAFGPLDFDGATAGIQNFDPTQHSLTDVVDAINRSFGSANPASPPGPVYLTASVVNNRLHIDAENGYQIGFGTDSTGLLAALGVNTFFTGEDASSMGVTVEVNGDPNRINAGHINGAGECNAGDNATALGIGSLRYKNVSVNTPFGVSTNQTITDYYAALVSTVGSDTAAAEFTYEYNSALSQDLMDRQEAVAGVNLDEEMSNLIKFQHSYRAAAKLITTADEMLQTVIGLKQ